MLFVRSSNLQFRLIGNIEISVQKITYISREHTAGINIYIPWHTARERIGKFNLTHLGDRKISSAMSKNKQNVYIVSSKDIYQFFFIQNMCL